MGTYDALLYWMHEFCVICYWSFYWNELLVHNTIGLLTNLTVNQVLSLHYMPQFHVTTEGDQEFAINLFCYFRHWLSRAALINEKCFLWMNKLGKCICWKIFGFMVVWYYIDSSQHFSVVWCCFKLADLVIAGVHWTNCPCTPYISATGNVFMQNKITGT